MTPAGPDTPARNTVDRFDGRVTDYARSRPDYPAAALGCLRERCSVGAGTAVADIGAGTGILSRQLLELGADVIAVEPNAQMRRGADAHPDEHLRTVDGTAEATTLQDASVDVITAGQAFHWFDQRAARAEFSRILRPVQGNGRPGGWVALLWNECSATASPFLAAYESLMRTSRGDYRRVDHRQVSSPDVVRAFLAPAAVQLDTFAHEQSFDWGGLLGRARSSSYFPQQGDWEHDATVMRLRDIFDRHAEAGHVVWEYRTLVFTGRLVTA